ncbi:MAG: hypothetical protein ACLRTG_15425 [Enterocloster aldenensis]
MSDRYRDEGAIKLLRTRITRKRAAEAVGYKNVCRINENFKGIYEQSPNEYREHHGRNRA